ncbi:MAG: hypothetical protein WC916_03385 [Candidatus Woesearchaeota archaeon]
MTKTKEEKEILFKKCPVCKKGEVAKITSKSFFGLLSSDNITCSNCKSDFIEQDEKEEERVFELDLSNSNMKNAYDGQALKVSEWERGTTDLDACINTNKLPNLKVVGLKIILSNDEKTHWYSGTRMMEERAVRNYQNFHVKGYSFGQAESHGELRSMDSGNLLLTNKRLIFNGDLKQVEYQLDKISSVEEYKDAVEIASSKRQKCQVYVVDEPHKWTVYIKIAISQFSKGKGTKQKTKITDDIVSDIDKHSLNEDVSKVNESLQNIKGALLKIQEKKNEQDTIFEEAKQLMKDYRYKEAEEKFKEAIKIKEYGYIYCGLGDLYYKWEKYDDAIATYKKALKIEPDIPYPKNAIEKVERKLSKKK